MAAVHLTRRHITSCRFPVHHKPKYTTFQVLRLFLTALQLTEPPPAAGPPVVGAAAAPRSQRRAPRPWLLAAVFKAMRLYGGDEGGGVGMKDARW